MERVEEGRRRETILFVKDAYTLRLVAVVFCLVKSCDDKYDGTFHCSSCTWSTNCWS